MLDKYVFSNGQALGTLNSTGVISSNYFDLEENAVTDVQVVGWLNVKILSSTNAAGGGTEGLDIDLITSDATNGGTPLYVGGHRLTFAEIAAGTIISIGVCKANLKRYLSVWYKAVSTSLSGATSVDAWFSEQPAAGVLSIQKKPS